MTTKLNENWEWIIASWNRFLGHQQRRYFSSEKEDTDLDFVSARWGGAESRIQNSSKGDCTENLWNAEGRLGGAGVGEQVWWRWRIRTIHENCCLTLQHWWVTEQPMRRKQMNCWKTGEMRYLEQQMTRRRRMLCTVFTAWHVLCWDFTATHQPTLNSNRRHTLVKTSDLDTRVQLSLGDFSRSFLSSAVSDWELIF